MKYLAISSLLLLTACSATDQQAGQNDATKIENPFRGVMQDRASSSPDEALFVEKCGMCHRQMGMGTVLLGRRMKPEVAMLEKRNDLNPDFIAVAARQGIGNMPRISRAEVSDDQLKQIANYLAKRKQP